MSLSVHEYAHGWVAYKCGDDTAKRMGRLTLNPIAHISFVGTIIMPLVVGFGWAKPVPVNFAVLSKRQIFMVAAAGPASNLAIVLALTTSFHVLRPVMTPFLARFITLGVLYNLILAIFNLIPIPPLDGSKMIYAGLKSPGAIGAYRHFSKFGIFILLGLLWFGGFERIVWPVIAKYYVLFELPWPFGR